MSSICGLCASLPGGKGAKPDSDYSGSAVLLPIFCSSLLVRSFFLDRRLALAALRVAYYQVSRYTSYVTRLANVVSFYRVLDSKI